MPLELQLAWIRTQVLERFLEQISWHLRPSLGQSLEQDDTQEERALKSVLEEWALGGSIDERALERILAETSEDEGGSE